MKITPVRNYKKPRYRPFTFKNGKLLLSGTAIMALMGTLGGCGQVEVSAGMLPAVDVSASAPTPSQQQIESFLGMLPAVDVSTPAPTPTPSTTATGVLDEDA